MKAPPKRKGNPAGALLLLGAVVPSMKAPPKRKGNSGRGLFLWADDALNESPSEKEGK